MSLTSASPLACRLVGSDYICPPTKQQNNPTKSPPSSPRLPHHQVPGGLACRAQPSSPPHPASNCSSVLVQCRSQWNQLVCGGTARTGCAISGQAVLSQGGSPLRLCRPAPSPNRIKHTDETSTKLTSFSKPSC